MEFLQGYKTYIATAVSVIVGLLLATGLIDPSGIDAAVDNAGQLSDKTLGILAIVYGAVEGSKRSASKKLEKAAKS